MGSPAIPGVEDSSSPWTAEGPLSPSTSAGSMKPFSPAAVRPYPKAGPRIAATKGRKKRTTAILTDTPTKQALEAEAEKRLAPRRLSRPTKL